MKDLYTYISENGFVSEEQVNEGLFKSSLGFAFIKKMDANYLLNGLLNMYEYIIGKSDIKLFYEDFPLKERPFWTNVYKLYESKIWSIYDTPKVDTSDDEKLEELKGELKDYEEEDDGRYKIKISQLRRQISQLEKSLAANISMVDQCFTGENQLIDVTPEFRRQLRTIIKDSANSQEDINANNVQKIMLINDPLFDKRYVFTINKILGLFRRAFKTVDVKMLEAMFMKIAEAENS